MKKAKIVFWAILGLFVVLLVYQNRDFFMSTHGLRVNLLIKEYETPKLQNIILFLIFFFAGLLISYFFSLFDRFKSRKIIKELSAALEKERKRLTELTGGGEALKTAETPDASPAPQKVNPEVEKDPDAS